MATVRDNPIPVGRYWSDLIGEQAVDRWVGWRAHVAQDRVSVITTVHHDADGDSPARDWVLYEVKAPVFYDHEFYAPVNSGTGVNDESDTVSKPAPEDIRILPDINIGGTFGGFQGIALAGIGLGIALGVVVLVGSRMTIGGKKNSRYG